MAEGAVRNRRLPASDRKDKLLDAAAAELADGGAGAFTIDGVTARAGVNRTLVHDYFKTRDGLLLALYEREHERMVAVIKAATGAAGDRVDDRLRAIVHAWLELADNQSLTSSFEGVQTDSGELERRRGQHSLDAAQMVAAELEQGFGLDRETALVASGFILGASITLVTTWRLSGWSRDRIEDLFVAMMLAAIRAAATEAPS